jgi:hypothetical protein
LTQSLQTTVRWLGPGDEDLVRKLAEGVAHTALLADEHTIYESLGGERSDAVMWDYRYAGS